MNDETLKKAKQDINCIAREAGFREDFDLFRVIWVNHQLREIRKTRKKHCLNSRENRKTIETLINSLDSVLHLLPNNQNQETHIVNRILNDYAGQTSFHEPFQYALASLNSFQKHAVLIRAICNDALKLISSETNEFEFYPSYCQAFSYKAPRPLKSPYKKGRKPGSSKIELIELLAFHYETSAKKTIKYGWDDSNDTHSGNFYQFLLKLSPILKTLSIELGKPRTIGDYIQEIMQNGHFKMKPTL